MSDFNNFVTNNGALRKYLGNGEAVVIPSGVTSIGDSAFYNCNTLTSITVPEGVKTIGKWAFEDCENLESIVLPDSLISIDDSAFYGCKSLASITIPQGVTHIGERVFFGCSNLTSVTLPKDIKLNLYKAFSYCNALSSIAIPHNATSIGHEAFLACTSLTSVEIPENINRIYGKAFSLCSSLTAITIPPNVQCIDKRAFEGCKNLGTITLPDSITRMEGDVFKGCKNLSTINLPKNIDTFEDSTLEIIWNHFFDTEHKLLIICAFLTQSSDSILNNKTVNQAIKDNKCKIINLALKKDDVELLGKLLALCETISLYELDEYIQQAESSTIVKAFLLNYKNENYSAEKLDEYENEKVLKELGLKDYSLEDWDRLYNFEIENETAIITGYKGNEKNITIPDRLEKYKVVAIGKYAFSPVLNNLNKTQKEARKQIQSIIIPYGVTRIDEGAFKDCERLTSITIPATVTNIGKNIFSWWYTPTVHTPAGSYAEQYAKENYIHISVKE